YGGASQARRLPARGARRLSSGTSTFGGGDEPRLDRQLGCGELHCLLRDLRRNATHLEQNAARLDHRDPAFGVTLARTHTGLGGLFGDGLVGEDTNPDLTAALDVAGHRAPRRLDLPVAHPARFHRLQAEVAERDRGTLRGDAGPATAMHLAVLDSLGDQHQLLGFLAVVVFLAAGLAGAFLAAAVPAASALGFGAALGRAAAGFLVSTVVAAARVRLGAGWGAGSVGATSTGAACAWETASTSSGCGAIASAMGTVSSWMAAS